MAVACGLKNTLIVDSDGYLQGCGASDKLMLGPAFAESSQGGASSDFIKISFAQTGDAIEPKVTLVSMNAETAALVTDDGDLYMCDGDQYDEGSDDEGSDDDDEGSDDDDAPDGWFLVPRQVFGNEAIIMADVSENGSIFLTKSGAVRIVGKFEYQDLKRGYSSQVQDQIGTHFSPEEFLDETIVMVSTGKNHAVALSNTGKVFTLGEDEEGQRGFFQADQEGSNLIPPERFQFTQGQHESPVFVTAFDNSTMVVTREGHLFVFGQDDFGKLGVHDPAVTPDSGQFATCHHEPTPVRQTAPDTESAPFGSAKVVVAKSSLCYSLVVTEDGALWGCGLKRGWEMRDDDEATSRFERVQSCADLKIVSVDIGTEHWTAITDKGEIFAFGQNRFAQTGIGSEAERTDGVQMVPNKKAGRHVELSEEFKLAFVMGGHERLGAGQDNPRTGYERLQNLFGFWQPMPQSPIYRFDNNWEMPHEILQGPRNPPPGVHRMHPGLKTFLGLWLLSRAKRGAHDSLSNGPVD